MGELREPDVRGRGNHKEPQLKFSACCMRTRPGQCECDRINTGDETVRQSEINPSRNTSTPNLPHWSTLGIQSCGSVANKAFSLFKSKPVPTVASHTQNSFRLDI